MEHIRLPFPSLQYLAGHAVGRCLVLMKVDKGYWDTNHDDSLRECELRVDKLRLPPAPRDYVKDVLRRFFKQIKKWIFEHEKNRGADIFVDSHGNVDEKKIARRHFEKLHKRELFREDFRKVVPFLEYLSWYHPSRCSNNFVSLIVNLQRRNTSLEGPEYTLVDEDLHVAFRFVNRRRVTRRSVPPEFNALLKFDAYPLKIFMEQNDVLVTYRVHDFCYNEDMLRNHVDLLQPSQRLQFLRDVLYESISEDWIQTVIHFLNVLDPQMRRNSLLRLHEEFATFPFLESCLIPGYEPLFIPMMQLLGLNLDSWCYFALFTDLVKQIHLIGFDSLLLQFWELWPASAKSEFRIQLVEPHDADWFYSLREAMKTLSQANMELFQVVFNYLSLGLPQQQTSSLLRGILH